MSLTSVTGFERLAHTFVLSLAVGHHAMACHQHGCKRLADQETAREMNSGSFQGTPKRQSGYGGLVLRKAHASIWSLVFNQLWSCLLMSTSCYR